MAKTYLALAKMNQDSFFNRRSYEWKAAFGLWTGIGIMTYYLLSNSNKPPDYLSLTLGIFYGLLLVVWHLFWQIPIRKAFWQDLLFKHYYMSKAEGRNANYPKILTYWEVAHTGFKKGQGFAWVWTQTAVTGLFLFASWMLVYFAAPKVEPQIVLEKLIPGTDLKLQIIRPEKK